MPAEGDARPGDEPGRRPGPDDVREPVEAPAAEPSRRRGRRTLLLTVPYVAAAMAVLHVLGIGGYRWGWVWLVLALAGGAGGLVWLLLGPRFASRGVWTLAVVIAGVAASGFLVERAPPSKGRLTEEMDALALPFYTVLSERKTGHSWCRPRCPVVEREYRAPSNSPQGTMAEILTEIGRRGIVGTDPAELRDLAAMRVVRLRGEDIAVQIRAERVLLEGRYEVRLTVRFAARR